MENRVTSTVNELGIDVNCYVLPSTANVLSPGKIIKKHGFGWLWLPPNKVFLWGSDAKRRNVVLRHDCPYVVDDGDDYVAREDSDSEVEELAKHVEQEENKRKTRLK